MGKLCARSVRVPWWCAHGMELETAICARDGGSCAHVVRALSGGVRAYRGWRSRH